MRFIAAPLAVVALALGGCQPSESPDPAAHATPSGQATPAGEAAPADTATPDRAGAAHYTIGGTTVPLGHAVRLPDVDGKLRFILTPDALDADEQATLRSESWTGMSLFSKRTALYGDRYPFVVVELRPGDATSADDVHHLYLMASSIAVPNHTDNINRAVHDHGVELLERDGGRVRVRASGQQEINGEVRSWSFDIAG